MLCGLFLGILRIFNQRRRIAVKDIGVGTWWRQHKYVANRDCCLPSGFAKENPAALEACADRLVLATRSFRWLRFVLKNGAGSLRPTRAVHRRACLVAVMS